MLTCKPIGFIRTTMRTKFDSPHQPDTCGEQRNVIELCGGNGFELALRDLDRFDRIWLLWWFHKNASWRPLVLPPRGEAIRRGVFATRSPHRPNPIGITTVPLIEVHKLSIIVGNTDLVDGTPILDIKPYIPNVDAFPDASMGWIADIENDLLQPPKYAVTYSTLAGLQIDWLRENWGIDFTERAESVLRRDPSIHRTRRIRKWCGDQLQMGCGAWRIIFSVIADAVNLERQSSPAVIIEKVTPGYPDSLLLAGGNTEIPDQAAQIAFKAIWPDEERVG